MQTTNVESKAALVLSRNWGGVGGWARSERLIVADAVKGEID